MLAQGSKSDVEATDSETLMFEALQKSNTSLKEAVEGLQLIKESKGEVLKYIEEARKRWPMAKVFEAKA